MKSKGLYRFSQFISLLLGARVFVLSFFTFTLYVSTFFLFNQEESLRNFVFDIKVNGIIFCSVLSIAAGGIINQFYDWDKDSVERPLRVRLQSFVSQKHFLYTYLFLNALSLVVALFLSYRIFFFFLFYQFVIWFYSHKLSKIAVVNNLTYVALTLYPFSGMLVYYQHFSVRIMAMAVFLFLILWEVDVMKDVLTQRSDKIFNYCTLPIVIGKRGTQVVLLLLLLLNAATAVFIYYADYIQQAGVLSIYFLVSAGVLLLSMIPIFSFNRKNIFWLMNLLRFWIFIGVLAMFLDGVIPLLKKFL